MIDGIGANSLANITLPQGKITNFSVEYSDFDSVQKTTLKIGRAPKMLLCRRKLKPRKSMRGLAFIGAPGETRTPDTRFRKPRKPFWSSWDYLGKARNIKVLLLSTWEYLGAIRTTFENLVPQNVPLF